MATFAAGIIKPFEDAVDQIFIADYAVTAQNGFDPIPPSVAEVVRKVPAVQALSGVRSAEGRVFNSTVQVTAVDAQASQVLALNWKKGSQSVLDNLGASGTFVDQTYAKDHHLDVGSPVAVETPTGQTVNLVVNGIYRSPPGGSPFGAVTMSTETFDRSYTQPLNLYTFARTEGGVTPANTQALQAALADFPNAKAVTRQQFKDDQVSGIQGILNILYVLLALSVVVSLFGIVNTLVLTVFERTRELGMLRAIGLTRRQTRRMIRHESVITALIGAVIGIVLGLVLAGLLTSRLDFTSFVVPVPQLIVFVVVAIIVGLFAAIFPARRAARLDPLDALQYE
jgi:ABC-type antimicrobial peptide transport system permease subunit